MSFRSSTTIESFQSPKYNFNYEWVLYKFTSSWEYILMSLGSTLTVYSFLAFVVINGTKNEPTIVHHIVSFVVVGLPLNYMQVVMGQYSQVGIILYKHNCPIGHGVGYALLFNSFLWCCYYGIQMADFLMYFLACIDVQLHWLVCPKGAQSRCWSANSECYQNCLSENISIASYVYWKELYMNNPSLDNINISLGLEDVARLVPLLITWSLIFTFISMGIGKYIKIVKVNLYLVSVLCLILCFSSFLNVGCEKGVAMMFRINLESFLSISAWSRSIQNVVHLLALNKAFHMMYGSYMVPHMTSDILTIFTVFLNFLSALVGSLITHSILGIIMEATGTKESDINFIWKDGVAPLFTVLPLGVGSLGVPQLWNMIYFLTCICILTNNLVTQIDGICRSVADAYSRISHYMDYIRATICILCFVCGFVFLGKNTFLLLENIFNYTLIAVHSFTLFVMGFLTFWIYSVQRLCDDIHFLQGFQPTKYWKICWYFLPVLLGFSCVHVTLFRESRIKDEYKMYIFIYLMFVLPIPIFAIYEVLCYLKIHNLIGLLQPEERWGPPDPQERHLRNLFNPRREIRSRRKNDNCPHECLIGNKYLKKVITEETNQRELLLKNVADEEAESVTSQTSI